MKKFPSIIFIPTNSIRAGSRLKTISGIIFITVVAVITGHPAALAISTTPTLSPTPQDTQIEKIKDLVASRVAELKLVDKRGFVGKVKSVSNSQITLVNNQNSQKIVEIDELTKFDGNIKTYGISDIKPEDMLSVIGLFNKQTEKLLARFVTPASNIPQNIEGVVTAKSIKDFTIDIKTVDGKKVVVNIETSTKIALFEDGETIKSGFSKIKNGDRIIVVGFFDKTNKDQINASRVIHFPGLALSNELKKDLEAGTESASPTESMR